jgi:hypothetical protein
MKTSLSVIKNTPGEINNKLGIQKNISDFENTAI